MFRIRDILVRDPDPRIRPLGLHLRIRMVPDPAPDPALFVSDLQDAPNNRFFYNLFCFLLSEGTVHLHN
jgi:hypothetical protein